MADEKVSVSIRLDPDVLTQIDASAADNSRSRSGLINHILSIYFHKKPRLSDKQTRGGLRK